LFLVKNMAEKILHNIRILDFTWVLAGPYATRLLADYGAEVIKVQPLLSTEDEDAFAQGYYHTWNRNKLGITLNLSQPEGIALVRGLIAKCDAVIENFTPRVMANWGLDYSNLKQIKSDIILVSVATMGRNSPQRDYTGFGPTTHALSGLTGKMALDGRPTGPGFSYADYIAGLYAAINLLAALEYRRQTGEGQHIALSATELMGGLINERVDQAVPGNIYRCKNGRWCAITLATEESWRGLKKALGNPAWAKDAEYGTPESRLVNKEALDRLIGTWTQERTAEEVMSLLQKNGVAAGIVQDAAGLARDPQLKAGGFFAGGGNAPFTDAPPVKMANQRADYRPAPSPGRDNAYVYGSLLGLSKEEIAVLEEKGVI